MSKQGVAILGALVSIIGAFCPVFSVPIMGTVNYFNNGRGDGIFILILSAMTIIFVLMKKYDVVKFTGPAMFAVLGYTYFTFKNIISDVMEQTNTELAGNPLRGIVDIAIQSVQIQWGFAVLLVGAILVTISIFVSEK